MIPQYTRIATTKPSLDDGDLLESLQNIPSNFDLALNSGTRRYLSPNPAAPRHGRYVSPNPRKDVDVTLLDPEAFRRLSLSTVSSIGRESRCVSPFLGRDGGEELRTWKTSGRQFWETNHGLFLVSISQLFGMQRFCTLSLILNSVGNASGLKWGLEIPIWESS